MKKNNKIEITIEIFSKLPRMSRCTSTSEERDLQQLIPKLSTMLKSDRNFKNTMDKHNPYFHHHQTLMFHKGRPSH